VSEIRGTLDYVSLHPGYVPGLWIENGELAYPVEKITVAGNLKEMFQDIEMVGNDLKMRGRIVSPTVKISRMTIAGD
jgi:PmbA protein